MADSDTARLIQPHESQETACENPQLCTGLSSRKELVLRLVARLVLTVITVMTFCLASWVTVDDQLVGLLPLCLTNTCLLYPNLAFPTVTCFIYFLSNFGQMAYISLFISKTDTPQAFDLSWNNDAMLGVGLFSFLPMVLANPDTWKLELGWYIVTTSVVISLALNAVFSYRQSRRRRRESTDSQANNDQGSNGEGAGASCQSRCAICTPGDDSCPAAEPNPPAPPQPDPPAWCPPPEANASPLQKEFGSYFLDTFFEDMPLPYSLPYMHFPSMFVATFKDGGTSLKLVTDHASDWSPRGDLQEDEDENVFISCALQSSTERTETVSDLYGKSEWSRELSQWTKRRCNERDTSPDVTEMTSEETFSRTSELDEAKAASITATCFSSETSDDYSSEGNLDSCKKVQEEEEEEGAFQRSQSLCTPFPLLYAQARASLRNRIVHSIDKCFEDPFYLHLFGDPLVKSLCARLLTPPSSCVEDSTATDVQSGEGSSLEDSQGSMPPDSHSTISEDEESDERYLSAPEPSSSGEYFSLSSEDYLRVERNAEVTSETEDSACDASPPMSEPDSDGFYEVRGQHPRYPSLATDDDGEPRRDQLRNVYPSSISEGEQEPETHASWNVADRDALYRRFREQENPSVSSSRASGLQKHAPLNAITATSDSDYSSQPTAEASTSQDGEGSNSSPFKQSVERVASNVDSRDSPGHDGWTYDTGSTGRVQMSLQSSTFPGEDTVQEDVQLQQHGSRSGEDECPISIAALRTFLQCWLDNLPAPSNSGAESQLGYSGPQRPQTPRASPNVLSAVPDFPTFPFNAPQGEMGRQFLHGQGENGRTTGDLQSADPSAPWGMNSSAWFPPSSLARGFDALLQPFTSEQVSGRGVNSTLPSQTLPTYCTPRYQPTEDPGDGLSSGIFSRQAAYPNAEDGWGAGLNLMQNPLSDPLFHRDCSNSYVHSTLPTPDESAMASCSDSVSLTRMPNFDFGNDLGCPGVDWTMKAGDEIQQNVTPPAPIPFEMIPYIPESASRYTSVFSPHNPTVSELFQKIPYSWETSSTTPEKALNPPEPIGAERSRKLAEVRSSRREGSGMHYSLADPDEVHRDCSLTPKNLLPQLEEARSEPEDSLDMGSALDDQDEPEPLTWGEWAAMPDDALAEDASHLRPLREDTEEQEHVESDKAFEGPRSHLNIWSRSAALGETTMDQDALPLPWSESQGDLEEAGVSTRYRTDAARRFVPASGFANPDDRFCEDDSATEARSAASRAEGPGIGPDENRGFSSCYQEDAEADPPESFSRLSPETATGDNPPGETRSFLESPTPAYSTAAEIWAGRLASLSNQSPWDNEQGRMSLHQDGSVASPDCACTIAAISPKSCAVSSYRPF